jgi:hypothetical protein
MQKLNVFNLFRWYSIFKVSILMLEVLAYIHLAEKRRILLRVQFLIYSSDVSREIKVGKSIDKSLQIIFSR